MKAISTKGLCTPKNSEWEGRHNSPLFRAVFLVFLEETFFSFQYFHFIICHISSRKEAFDGCTGMYLNQYICTTSICIPKVSCFPEGRKVLSLRSLFSCIIEVPIS